MQPTNKILKEDLTKADVEKEVAKQLDSKMFKSVIDKVVKDRLKDSPELEGKMIEISKNVLTQLFKTLWTKRSVWRGGISNKSS